MTQDEKYIYRCIQLAYNGLNNTAPNPMVGAVIVHNNHIIGEGYHIRCGEAHAEVNAIRSVKNQELLKESTIYVSLEPCSHYGKTPPCADLIIEKKIPRVVIGCVDPFSLVSGRGIQKLKNAGIEVTVGVLEEECKQLIKRFTTFNIKKRPLITLKWAQSADGFIDKARTQGSATILSTPITSLHVHKLRTTHQGILVGRKTALLDNPSLSSRYWYGENPIRMIIDRERTLPAELNIFDGQIPTWIFTSKPAQSTSYNIRYIPIDFTQRILPQILQTLHEAKIQSLLVEGGSQLLQSFIDEKLWDEIFVEHSKKRLQSGIKAPQIPAGYPKEHLYYDHTPIMHYFNTEDK